MIIKKKRKYTRITENLKYQLFNSFANSDSLSFVSKKFNVCRSTATKLRFQFENNKNQQMIEQIKKDRAEKYKEILATILSSIPLTEFVDKFKQQSAYYQAMTLQAYERAIAYVEGRPLPEVIDTTIPSTYNDLRQFVLLNINQKEQYKRPEKIIDNTTGTIEKR